MKMQARHPFRLDFGHQVKPGASKAQRVNRTRPVSLDSETVVYVSLWCAGLAALGIVSAASFSAIDQNQQWTGNPGQRTLGAPSTFHSELHGRRQPTLQTGVSDQSRQSESPARLPQGAERLSWANQTETGYLIAACGL